MIQSQSTHPVYPRVNTSIIHDTSSLTLADDPVPVDTSRVPQGQYLHYSWYFIINTCRWSSPSRHIPCTPGSIHLLFIVHVIHLLRFQMIQSQSTHPVYPRVNTSIIHDNSSLILPDDPVPVDTSRVPQGQYLHYSWYFIINTCRWSSPSRHIPCTPGSIPPLFMILHH